MALRIGLIAVFLAACGSLSNVPAAERASESEQVDAVAIERQAVLVVQLRFELEVLREDMRQEDDPQFMERLREEHRLCMGGTLQPEVCTTIERLSSRVRSAAPDITDPRLKGRFQTDVVDRFDAMRAAWEAKHPR